MSRLEKLKQNSGSQPLPYTRTEKEREPHTKGWLAITGIVVLFGALVYLLFFTPFFNIKTIEVNGYTDGEKVKQIVTEQEGRGNFASNIFLFNKETLSSTLAGDSLISDIQIKKILPNKLIINITESKPTIIWATAGDKYLVDERGDVIGPATSEKLPLVYDSADIKVGRGDKVASPLFIKFITTVWSEFEPATKTKISKILIFDLISDVHVLSSAGWSVYMDASKDPNTELTNLTKVLAEAQKTTKKLEYIDLRLEDKAFYK